jgi:Predicted membrane protein
MAFLYSYLAAISLIGFFMMAADKNRAKKAESRISERSLFTVAWIGGSIGVLLGIYAFRHKTLHKRFTIGVPFIIVAQVCIVLFIINYKIFFKL